MNLLNVNKYLEDMNSIFSDTHSSFFGKRIMVTGGLGLIGSACVDYLLFLNLTKNAGISITIADINEKLFFDKYKSLANVFFLFYDAGCDLNIDFDFDYIIHCAGIASPSLYVNKPVETIDSHIVGVRNILRKTKGTNTVFLYVSSSEIYGERPSNKSDEKSYGVLDIDNVRLSYAVSKQMCEMICKSYFAEFGSKVLIVRPGHVYGPSASPNDSRVSSSFCYDAARGRDIVLKSNGAQVRSYCYSLDCVSAILFLLNAGTFGETYNIGAKEKISINDMAEIVSSFAGVNLVRLCPAAKEEKSFNPMNDSSLDSNKLESLGFRYCFDVREGFEHTISILKEVLG